MPRPGRDEVARRLLDAAHEILANEGSEGLTVRRLAAAAGVSTMNVYSRFGGKDGVVEELYIDGFRRLGAAVDEIPPSEDPIEDLRRGGQIYRSFANENPTYYLLMFGCSRFAYEPSERAGEIALGTLRRLEALVARAIEQGAIDPAHDPAILAGALWSCTHGVTSLELSAPDPRGVFDWDAIAEQSFRSMISGVALVDGAR